MGSFSLVDVARIDVDETGTTAGAATDVESPAHTARPFLYFIRDRGSEAILFLGHITDPTQTS